MMELKDTMEMMQSADYKERFKAEYFQLSIRLEKLNNLLNNWDNLDFTPTCTKEILQHQAEIMEEYLAILCERARIEKVELSL